VNVVFDLGGVVLTWDREAIIASVFDSLSERDRVREGVFKHPDWHALDRGTLARGDAIVRAAARTGIDAARIGALFEAIPMALVPVPETLALVSQVRAAGSRLLVLSNLHAASLARIEHDYDIFPLFDGRIVSCEVGACKPDPEIYAALLGTFDLVPDDTVFIDDTEVNLDAAREFGMRTILFEDVTSCRRGLQDVGGI